MRYHWPNTGCDEERSLREAGRVLCLCLCQQSIRCFDYVEEAEGWADHIGVMGPVRSSKAHDLNHPLL